ncbi:MAG: glycosyltransferase [Blastocatellia bacterium]|jgi:dolichol-phosphate mannosyltransferase|nr:glycosyltransferase [Blastocatellia bacterium]MBK6425813.1 glycosyltransferase [Blastocatellia bacterium]
MTENSVYRLSVLVLTRNEAENLESLLPEVSRVLRAAGHEYEITVVDAASKDGTEDVARRHGASVIQQSVPGYANALRQGIAACTGDAILTIDADLSHRPSFILDLLDRRDDAEILIASRYVAGGSADMPASRLVLSRVLNILFGRLLGIDVRDMSSGFRLYDRRVVQSLDARGEHFDVLPELVALALEAGHRVVEVPFHYHPRDAGVSKARIIAFGPSYARTLGRCLAARWRSGRSRP